MAPKIFLYEPLAIQCSHFVTDASLSTGVTGYIAGDALYALHEKHPDYEYSALVRTQDKADVVKKAFPNIRIVLGGNDDSDLLKEEAAKADVVLRISTPSLHKHHATSH